MTDNDSDSDSDSDDDGNTTLLERLSYDALTHSLEDLRATLGLENGDDGDEDRDDDDGDGDGDRDDDDDDADEDEDADHIVTDGGWDAAESPTSRTLHGVAHAVDGPYACGEGGLLLHRDGGDWRTLLERGPGVASNTLRSIDVTDDGCRLWFAGDSGALGVYDVADGRISDYSAPMEKTSTWEAIAVAGQTGQERLRIANGSGEVLDVVCEDGCPTWGEVVEPGGGSTIPGLATGPDGFYAIDTSGGVYLESESTVGSGSGSDSASTAESGSTDDATTDEPESEAEDDTAETAYDEWERIGVRNAEVNFYDIWAGEETVYVAGADGIAYRYDPACENWTPLHVGEGALQAIRAVGTDAVAAATGGRLYERSASIDWERLETPTEQSLFGLALARSREDSAGGLGTVPVDMAVGAGGAILERSRSLED
ncbi:hypothetical protein [Halomontanus rarus]|uniref:hypothetical protein n=1 Tax=Halomontanus rarus TaxID=3034020 RepID=UPI0023E8B1FA|nr:hypothetical protein [Halovivax sp. TS33]